MNANNNEHESSLWDRWVAASTNAERMRMEYMQACRYYDIGDVSSEACREVFDRWRDAATKEHEAYLAWKRVTRK